MEGKSVHSSAGKSKETKNSEDKGDVDTEENETKEATEIIEHDKDVSNVSPNDKPNNKETSIDENKDEDIAVISKNVESTKENITDSKSETLHESESIISQPLESQSIQQQTETEPQTGSGWDWGGIGNLLSTSVAAVSDSIGNGIGSVVNNVESTLGVRRPQEMIRDDITVIITNTEKNVESTKENITNSESETPHESESITSQPLESQSIQQQTETEPQTGSGWGWGGIGNLLSTSVAAVSDSVQAIGKGIGSVVTNDESTLGVPRPQEMIRYQEVEEDFKKKEEKDDQHG